MARIAGVDLPRNKRVEIALTYIFGLGRFASNVVLKQAGISPDKRTDDLDENDVRKIRDAIDANFRVEGDLRRDTQLSIPPRPVERFELALSTADFSRLRLALLLGLPGAAMFLGLIVYWTRRT